MYVTGITSWSLVNRDDYKSYAKHINGNHANLRITSANRLTGREISIPNKSNVAISPQMLQKVSGNENMMDQLDRKLKKIDEATRAFSAINQAEGHELSVTGYLVDRNGNITVQGVDLKTEEDFSIRLGKISERVSFKEKIYEHFGVSATNLMFASMKLR